MDAPEPLPDRQRAGRVNRSPTVWERKAADAAAQAYANSPAAREINRLSKDLADIQRKLKAMRGENGIDVVGEGEIIRLVAPLDNNKGDDDAARTEQYFFSSSRGLCTGKYDVTQIVTVPE